jgi:hypothetical protein
LKQETIDLQSSLKSMYKELDSTRNELQRSISRQELVEADLVAKSKEKEKIASIEVLNSRLAHSDILDFAFSLSIPSRDNLLLFSGKHSFRASDNLPLSEIAFPDMNP